jgi:hypothetical protein
LAATVDFPEPDPPAIPMINGLSIRKQSYLAGVWNAVCLVAAQTDLVRIEL